MSTKSIQGVTTKLLENLKNGALDSTQDLLILTTKEKWRKFSNSSEPMIVQGPNSF